jgi:glucokinase
MKSNHALCLDIGGGHVTSALVDIDSKSIIHGTRQRAETDAESSAESFIEKWSGAGSDSLKRGVGCDLNHVGIAMPGPYDYERGVSNMEHKFVSLYQRNVLDLLREAWRDTLSCPIRFANDADMFALGESWAGAGDGCKRVIGITLGTGLGSGFVENGRAITDDNRIPSQGEIWNVPFAEGKAEDYASGKVLRSLYEKLSGEVKQGAEIASLATQGDRKALSCFNTLGENLVAILQPWVRSFAPDAVVFGGNVSQSFDLFGEVINSGIDARCVRSVHFEDASLYGGAALGAATD